MKNKFLIIFMGLLGGYVLLIFLSNKFVFTENLYYYSFGSQLTQERISQLLSLRSRVEWLGYLFTPIVISIKIFIVSLILYTGTILSGLKVEFKNLFHVVLQAEFAFLFAVFVKFYWIYVFMSDVSLKTISFFQPLSIINFFSIGEIPKWLVYPMQLVNLFEIGYWLLLAYLLEKIIKKSFWKSFEFVLSTYGIGLLIWAVFVVFLTLNLT